MGAATYVVCHEHKHEEEGYEYDHSVQERPVHHTCPANRREPVRLIVSKNAHKLSLVGVGSPWSVFTLAASFSAAPKPNPPLPLLGKDLSVDPLRVRSQPLEKHPQKNDGDQGEHKVNVRPDVP